MGRRKYLVNRKTDSALGVLILALVVIGGIISAIVKFFEKVGFLVPAIILLIAIGCFIWVKKKRNTARAEAIESARLERIRYLSDKYKDATAVARIMNGEAWIGQTAEQLRDSLNKPEDIDTKVMKSKIRETWKYGQYGTNRYRLRIVLEDNIVVGWEKK